MNWEIIKNYCDKYSIEFKNQTFTQFIKELRTQFLDCKRDIFTKETKDKVINKCNNCDTKSKFYEVDHIQPLAAGGNNDLNNLQILCKVCLK